MKHFAWLHMQRHVWDTSSRVWWWWVCCCFLVLMRSMNACVHIPVLNQKGIQDSFLGADTWFWHVFQNSSAEQRGNTALWTDWVWIQQGCAGTMLLLFWKLFVSSLTTTSVHMRNCFTFHPVTFVQVCEIKHTQGIKLQHAFWPSCSGCASTERYPYILISLQHPTLVWKEKKTRLKNLIYRGKLYQHFILTRQEDIAWCYSSDHAVAGPVTAIITHPFAAAGHFFSLRVFHHQSVEPSDQANLWNQFNMLCATAHFFTCSWYVRMGV